jgi:transcriptional regulator GlxA family with amidase domain
MWLDRLRELGAEPTEERVVEHGKVITAAGVSAGIDMALRLVQIELGDQVAQAIQLSIEYDPQPPVDAGSTSKAPPEIVDVVRRAIEAAEVG